MAAERFRKRFPRVAGPFSPQQKDDLERARASGDVLECPACRVAMDQKPVPPNPFVSYVRRRLLLTCPSCHGHLVLDESERE